ncbi:hypothetical protein [Flagellimonas sp. 2504JD1-5]
MNKILFAVISLLTVVGNAQEIKFIKKLPFPNSIVSSELTMSLYNNHLIASILTVNPNALTPTYGTLLMESYNLGKDWAIRPAKHTKEAADPWITMLGGNKFVFTDISEGNRFHLQSFVTNNGKWEQPISHGVGHDYATVLSDSGSSYIFSTQKVGSDMVLYVYKTKNGTSKKRSIEVFNGVDLSFKKPVFVNDQIAIPVVLRGSWNGKSSTNFGQMTSWLLMLDKQSLDASTPLLITHLSGAKHHILVKGIDKLYYFFTDVERKELSVVMSSDLGKSWTKSKLVAKGDYLINLDAAVWYKDHAVIVFTNEESKGSFQKYVLHINEKMEASNPIKLGRLSRPDQRNGWAVRAWPQGGDYCGLVANEPDGLYIMWSSAPDGVFNPYFAKISIK